MLSRLLIDGGYMWSAWQPDRGMPFNSYFFRTAAGGVAIDPLPLDEAAIEQLRSLGGVAKILITNRDHVRGSQALAQAFNAPVVTEAAGGEELFPGGFAVRLDRGKAPEFAIHLREHRAAVIGDALIGAPAGSLSLLPDEKLPDPRAMAFDLRRLWALELQTLLLCDGYPVFHNADAALCDMLYAREGGEIFRVNASELEPRPYREIAGKYGVIDTEVGLLIGARKMGYRIAEIPPGKAFCPLHWHAEEEEFFYVLEGTPSIRMASGTFACRAGDFIAFPVGERGAHQLLNESAAPAKVLLVGLYEPHETCVYPDSKKILTDTRTGFSALVRSEPELAYFDGEL